MSDFELYQITWKEWLVLAITLILAFILLTGAHVDASTAAQHLQSLSFE